MDNYGLSFLNDMTGDKKGKQDYLIFRFTTLLTICIHLLANSGSELMAYQPNMYDLSDILDTDDNKAGQDAANGGRSMQNSVLNTPNR